MYDTLIEIVYYLLPFVVCIIVQLLSTLICYIKIKHQQMHDDSNTDCAFNLEDYYYVDSNNTLHELSEIKLIKKEEQTENETNKDES